MLDRHRIYAYLQAGRWFRQVSSIEVISLGGCGYNTTTQFAEQTIEITFNTATHKLIYLPEKRATAFQLNIQGLTKSALEGSTTALPGYIPYQLPLPFVYPDTTF